jgi:hypothetical protein
VALDLDTIGIEEMLKKILVMNVVRQRLLTGGKKELLEEILYVLTT